MIVTEPYIGLTNQGATCYMNSFLQFLYMTPEFREAIFGLEVCREDGTGESDNIPYQLQKLFAKLSLKRNRSVSTRALTESFQWKQDDTWVQHDATEFGKILFDAIADSLSPSQRERFSSVVGNYEGGVEHLVKCLQCGEVSAREELFRELQLIVRNEVEKLNFKKLENSLYSMLRPVKLDGENCYSCARCETKTEALKSLEFRRFPKVLIFNVNRFVFDLYSYDRIKVNNYFEFPLTLDMSVFEGNFDEVSRKGFFEDNERLEDFLKKQNARKVAERPEVLPSKGKRYTNSKTSAQTREFLKNLRNRGKAENDFQPLAEQIESLTQPLCETKSALIEQKDTLPPRETQSAIAETKNPTPQPSCEIKSTITEPRNTSPTQTPTAPREAQSTLQVRDPSPTPPPPPPRETQSAFDAPTDILGAEARGGPRGPVGIVDGQVGIRADWSSETPRGPGGVAASTGVLSERQESEFEKHSSLSSGMCYSLYAVFIHRGSAHGGHYYVYIRSFEDNAWYLFDDYQVRETNVADVFKDGFGGPGSDVSAYMLAYRAIPAQSGSRSPRLEVPSKLRAEIDEEARREEEATKRKSLEVQANSIVRHKICWQLEVKQVEVNVNRSFKEFEEMVMDELGLTPAQRPLHRLRLCGRTRDEFLDDFLGRKELTLKELKLNSAKTFGIETRAEGANFAPFLPGHIVTQVELFSPAAASLDYVASPRPIAVPRAAKPVDIETAVRAAFDRPATASLRLFVRRAAKGGAMTLVPLDEAASSIGGSTVYADFDEPDGGWPALFEAENNSVIVRFNQPGSQEPVEFSHRVRAALDRPLAELKTAMRGVLGLPGDYEFVVKRGGRHGVELRDLGQPLKTFRLPKEGSLYLAPGKALLPHEARVGLWLTKRNTRSDPLEVEKTFEFIDEIQVSMLWKTDKLVQYVIDTLGDKLVEWDTQLDGPLKMSENPTLDTPGNEPVKKLDSPHLEPTSSSSSGEKPANTDHHVNSVLENSETPSGVQIPLRCLIDPATTRVREKLGTLLGRAFRPGTLKSQGLADRKHLALEPFRRSPGNSEVLALAAELGETGQTRPATELFLPRKGGLYEAFPGRSAARVRDPLDFNPSDLDKLNFFELKPPPAPLDGPPFYLDSDGAVFVVQPQDPNLTPPQNSSSTRRFIRPKRPLQAEKPLKIFVKKPQGSDNPDLMEHILIDQNHHDHTLSDKDHNHQDQLPNGNSLKNQILKDQTPTDLTSHDSATNGINSDNVTPHE